MDVNARLDALAILAAALRDDREGIEHVVNHCDMAVLVAALAAAVIDVLRDNGTDPAEWVAAQQALARDELGAGPG